MTNKRLTLCVVTALIATGLSAEPAQAAFTVTILQEGSNVVVTGSGTINTTDLHPGPTTSSPIPPTITASFGQLSLGPSALQVQYTGITGPTSFGSGMNAFCTTCAASGDTVGIIGAFHSLYLPVNYVSGNPLMDTTPWPGRTFSSSSLGITPGTYEWTWGTGANADSFTLKAETGVSAVPEPATLALLGLGLVGLGLSRRRLAR